MEIHWAVRALLQRHKEELRAKLKTFLQNESLPLSTRFHNTELTLSSLHGHVGMVFPVLGDI